MSTTSIIPVIDLFAGPGGLGEGFSQYESGEHRFKIVLSVEMEENAHNTLALRAFFRQFPKKKTPKEYYAHIRGEIDRKTLFTQYPLQAESAKKEALQAELGVTEPGIIDEKISEALEEARVWVLIGGPPCQAYSLVGRSRNKGNSDYIPQEDKRHFLYKEYLRIIEKHKPPLFVMENVKGLLSSKIEQASTFDAIIQDLTGYGYNIYSFAKSEQIALSDSSIADPRSYVIKAELYGVPQARHRVILLGLKKRYNGLQMPILKEQDQVNVKSVIKDLPRVRSGLSKEDSGKKWREVIRSVLHAPWLKILDSDIQSCITDTVNNIHLPNKKRGSEFVTHNVRPQALEHWFNDSDLKGVCNHTTRCHIHGDIHRYLFASSFAKIKGFSPVLKDFPELLQPNHKNVTHAIKHGRLFSDRFRVQLGNRFATTITSHISKDGHYYIHYDPSQCRSLTVREAARLQTFPDNYFFCGARTAQYRQVGNAVPPYLAYQIAGIVSEIIEDRIL